MGVSWGWGGVTVGFRFQVSGRPARGTSTAGGGPRKRGAPNRHRAAYSVPPSRVEAGGPWQHPAPPGADTCRFQGGGGGGPRSVWVGRWGCTCAAAVFSWEGGGGGAAWGCAWAQRGTAQGCGAGPLHRGVAWDCAGVQRLRSVAVWGFAGAQHGASPGPGRSA